MKSDLRALAAAVCTVVLWASAFVVIRDAAAEYAPGSLALGRLLVGAIALGLLLLLRGEGLPPRAALPGIVLSGLLWFGVYMVALNAGEKAVDAGTAAMIVNIGPILIAVLGGWFLREGFHRRVFSGMAVSFLGTVVVGVSFADEGSAPVLGVLLCLVAALSYAGGAVSQKPALRHASALQVTMFGCLIGAVACLPFAGQLVADVGTASWTATAGVAYLGLFPTALAFTTWAYALARTTAGRMGATTYAVPAVVVVMSGLLLREVPGPITLAGGVLCLVGVAVARSGRPVRTERGGDPHDDLVGRRDRG